MIEYERYKKAIEKLFLIVDKTSTAIPYKLNSVQNRVLKELSGMDIILKARQQGMSSLILAIFTIDFLFVENIRCVVISHESGATQRLFDRVKYYLDSLKKTFPGELPYKLKYNNRNELVNLDKNSVFYIGTAGARAFGHGDTINNLHVSELSRWENQERTMTGLLQAVPKGGKVIVETTANGFGNYFYNLWTAASNKRNPFLPHFVPWFETPEYHLPVFTGTEFEQEELDIANKYHLTKEQLMWRRWKLEQLNSNLDLFNEQFPATPEEAFIVSGNPVWSPSMLRFYMLKSMEPKVMGNLFGFNPVSVERNERGFLSVYKLPEEFHRYVIGADVSEGKIVSEGEESRETDFSCAQVIDQSTMEQVAVWHGKIEPDQFGRQLEMLGRYYNEALIGVERNSMGLATLITIRDLNYSNLYYREKFGLIADKVTDELGWVTDHATKEMAISDATRYLRDRRISIYDSQTVSEMISFVRNANGSAGAAQSAHDDRVMALLIAIQMLGKQRFRETGNSIERPDYSDGLFEMNGVTFNSQGMPVDPNATDGDDISI